MNNVNPFYDKMKALTDEELLKVLSIKEDYNPEAAKAAESVFEERGLSKDVVDSINETIRIDKVEKQEKDRKRKEKIDEVLSIASVFSNGVTSEIDSKQLKGFKLFIIGLSIYYLYGIYGAYPFLEFLWMIDDFSVLPVYLEMFIILILFPVGIFLLARLKKEGWLILFYFFMGKLLMISGVSLVGFYFELSDLLNPKRVSIFDGLTYQTNWINNVMILLTLSAVIWYMLKDSVMRLSKINPNKKRSYTFLATGLSVLYIAVYYSLMMLL
ncbi:MAG: hypothetical protein ACPGSL_10680 [Vicingaceae bacterium]